MAAARMLSGNSWCIPSMCGSAVNRIAVTFEYQWHDDSGEFADNGLMQRRIASINDAPIREAERRIR